MSKNSNEGEKKPYSAPSIIQIAIPDGFPWQIQTSVRCVAVDPLTNGGMKSIWKSAAMAQIPKEKAFALFEGASYLTSLKKGDLVNWGEVFHAIEQLRKGIAK